MKGLSTHTNLFIKLIFTFSLLFSFTMAPHSALAAGDEGKVRIQFDCGAYIGLIDLYRSYDAEEVLPESDWVCDSNWISEPTSYENACNIMNVSPSGAIYIIIFGMKTKSKSCSYE